MRIESTPKNPLTPYPPKGGLPNSMIFRCSPLGLGVKHLKIIEFPTFRSKVRIPALIIFLIISTCGFAQNQGVKIALLKYNGGGDWYANPTSLPNLIKFCNSNLKTNIFAEPSTVELSSPEIFNFPFIHATGHGNIIFSESEATNLRTYLEGGGFLHVDDNYGLNEYFRREMKKVFPEKDLIELPPSHPIFHQKYTFNEGLPKIHEHDGKQPQAFGIFIDDRMVCLYTYECDLGDGWEDIDVHNDPEETRLKALKMGANIIQFVFNQ